MKTYINRFSHYLFLAGILLMTSCASDDNSSVANQVNAATTSGAILRTISINTGTFTYTDTAVEWSATLEAQGAGNGSAISEVKLYASYTAGDVTTEEAYVKSYPGTNFSPGPNEYPRADFNVSLLEVITALGIAPGDYANSDSFNLRFEMTLTDGRTFSADNASATVTGGSYLNSPFQYPVQFFCILPDASIYDGNYSVVKDDWADYAQGATIPVVHNPSDGPFTFRVLSTNNSAITNNTTSYILVTVDPSDGTVTAESNEDFDYPGFAVLPVTGSGTVGTCTGDISLVLDFGGYTENKLILKKN